MDFQREQRRLTTILGIWAGASMAAGGTAWAIGSARELPSLTSCGRQFALWGAVDGAIAVAGALRGGSTHDEAAQVRRLRRILLVNAGLDVLYLAAGVWLIARPTQQDNRLTRGDGAAIAMQGAFLLALDTTMARRLA